MLLYLVQPQSYRTKCCKAYKQIGVALPGGVFLERMFRTENNLASEQCLHTKVLAKAVFIEVRQRLRVHLAEAMFIEM